MTEPALLLMDDSASGQERRVGRVLQFFGIPSRNLAAAEVPFASAADGLTPEKPRILCSTEVFLRVIEAWEQNPACKQWWTQSVHSAFIYSNGDSNALQRLARVLSGNDRAVVGGTAPGAGDFVVSDRLKGFCGVMSGVRVNVSNASSGGRFVLNVANPGTTNIISSGNGATFLQIDYEGVPVFISTSKEIIDLNCSSRPLYQMGLQGDLLECPGNERLFGDR